jgi:hypothetical protein
MNLLQRMKLTRGMPKVNTPNPDCPEKCKDAHKAHIEMCNTTNDVCDVTKIISICATCGKSMWLVKERKETAPKIEEEEEQ